MSFFYNVYYKYPLYFIKKQYSSLLKNDLDFFNTTFKAYTQSFKSNTKAMETLKKSEKNINDFYSNNFIIKKKYEN
jgi:mannose/fructose/N-acetylgalactosamine-specific phosphotransferase system component IID